MDNTQLIVDALLRTDPRLYQQIDGPNSWADAVSRRGARIKLYRRYERGDHRANITDQMRKMLRLTQDDAELNDFNDNYIRLIVDKMAGRVFAAAILSQDEAISEWIKQTTARNSFEGNQGTWWRGAIRDGNSYVMIDPETGLWTSEPAFDQYSGMVTVYDQKTRRIIWACKAWSEADELDVVGEDDDASGTVVIRLVVYQPDKISFWRGQDGSATVEPDMIDAGANVRAWPLGMRGRLPIVSFGNARDAYTQYGESEIRPAVPLQDVLNRTLHSMVMASEFAAYPVNISIGMAIDPAGIVPGAIVNLVLRDSTGNAITDFSAEQIEFIKTAKVTQLQAADLSQYTNQITQVVKEISQATQTPIYGVTSQGALSGDALKQLEIGLIGKVERFQRENTDALKDLIILTAMVERTFAPGAGAPDIQDVAVLWKPAELLDVDAKIKSLSEVRKNNPGLFTDDFYRERIGGLLGMAKEQIMEQNELATNQAALNFERLVGANGGTPVV